MVLGQSLESEPYPNGIYKDWDGQEWTYSVHTNYCEDLAYCGSSDEKHWVESGTPEWLKESEEEEYISYSEEDDGLIYESDDYV